MASLYRKYRPSTFDQVIGQDFVKQTIQNEIKTGKLAHAYLFSGPRGVGKTTLARLIAKSANCQNRKDDEFEPCNECPSCLEINQNKSVDIIELDAASNRKIEHIRELREKIRFAPSSSKFKIFIIDEVHMLTNEAFNALLKTLEEPPSYAIFILATTEIHKIPETIISRCQRFDFKRVEFKDIVKRLEKISKEEGFKIEKEVLENIAYHSEGHPRDAESLLSQVLAIADKDNKVKMADVEMILPASNFDLVIQFIEYLFENNVKKSLKLINKIAEDGLDLKSFTANAIKMLHKMILVKAGLGEMTWQLEKSLDKKVHQLVKDIENYRLAKMIEILNQAKQELQNYALHQIALEVAVLKIVDLDKLNNDGNEDDDLNGKPENNIDLEINQQVEKNVEPEKSQIEKVEIEQQKEKPAEPPQKIVVEEIKTDTEDVAEFVEAQSENLNVKESKVSMYEIKGKWPEIVRKIGEKNRSMVALMEVCVPTAMNGKSLCLTVPYKFYIDKIKESANMSLIENTLFEVLNCRISINSELGEKPKVSFKTAPQSNPQVQEKSEPDPQMNSLLEAFGGEVVG